MFEKGRTSRGEEEEEEEDDDVDNDGDGGDDEDELVERNSVELKAGSRA